MKLNLKSIALIAGLAVLIIGSVFAVARASADLSSQAATDLAADCGGLRMDEFYACKYGGWQPTPAAEDQEVTGNGANCGGLRLDEYYACEHGGWQAPEDTDILAQ